mmetsp:Transcript_28138/g.62784  ORF Transcript_28138/g.62784 Transcript_28138/m.62784 type:complete len:213 (+) Transcript_28138:1738-2376(+)
MAARRSSTRGCVRCFSPRTCASCFLSSDACFSKPEIFSLVTLMSLFAYCSLVLSSLSLPSSSETAPDAWGPADEDPILASSARSRSLWALSWVVIWWSQRPCPGRSCAAFPPVMVPALEITEPSRVTALTFSPRRKHSSRASSRVSHTTVFSTAYITAGRISSAQVITSRQSLDLFPTPLRSRSFTSLVLIPCSGMKAATPMRFSRMYWMHS